MVGIKGIDTVTAGMEKALGQMMGKASAGLRVAVRLIRSDMDRTPPLIPIGKNKPGYVGGHLRSTWFANFTRGSRGEVAVFGFTADYAVFVHERVEGARWGDGVVGEIDWSRPNSGPKFLESSLKRNADEAVRIIANTMRK